MGFNGLHLQRRSDLRASLDTMLLYPAYRMFCTLCRLHGLLRNAMVSAPWEPKVLAVLAL